ncbi:glycosyltransferase involved in cell wall biosynthesis [Sphingomonas jinjuensis]|uniref:Glycosyltransferase involved in cell wall biosynthesis n=1 Tax=Sphingomonas jinjuensis TaxID=535907 RepID=A0A840F794_9SPHN|nr:glycosyltransferase family 4 protein [Sphingomonas jinjuensis]MBB4155133.1 glycosyltransferase involved in cell wall biosynthesis [Sphingomonas jinjuensis]
MSAGQPLAGKRLLLLTRYTESGASSRLRLLQFVPALERAGAAVTVDPFFDEAYLAAYYAGGRKPLGRALAGYRRRLTAIWGRKADLVWVEKELFPFLPGATERMLGATPYVVDYDDAVFHGYDRHRLAPVRWVLGRKLHPLITGAAAVTAGNAYLADYARRAGARRVELIPTVVDPARYPVTPPPGGTPLRVGWIGTPANARYLAPVIEALGRLHRRHPVVLVTIGAPALPDLPIPQEAHAWREATEGPLLAGIDIGVMPLPDSPFERGKCGYKLIQYMAAGRPVIASPVGVNSVIVDDAVGYLADDADAWEAALTMLAQDPAQRGRMGAAGRAKVEREYSTDVIGPRLVRMFAELMA